MRPATRVAASSCIAGMAWLYVSSVTAMLECPRRSWTTFGWTLALSMSVACVAKAVNLDPREADGFRVLSERLRDAVWVDGLPVRSAEHEPLVAVGAAEELLLLGLLVGVAPQGFDGLGVERQQPSATLALRGTSGDRPTALGALLNDGQPCRVEVHV